MSRDRRRQFLIAAGALLVAPGAVRAQPAQKLRRIGVLALSVSGSEQAQWGRLVFASWMRAAGYEEGKNLAIEWRYAEGDASRLPALAEELVRLNVELILASFNDAIAAARRATRSIPIVMFNAVNPVEQGFVESLARPGGNVTGTAWSAPDPVLASGMVDIVAFALKHKLPAIANASPFVDAGGLLCYGPDVKELGDHTGGYVTRILGGAKPADLPVQLPTRFELVVNLKTAKRIGLKIPQSILLRADRVIE